MDTELQDKAREMLRHIGYESFAEVFITTENGRLLLALICNLMARVEREYYDWKTRFIVAAVENLDRSMWWLDQHETVSVVLINSSLHPDTWEQPAQFAFHLTRAEDIARIDLLDPPEPQGRRWARVILTDYIYDLINFFLATEEGL